MNAPLVDCRVATANAAHTQEQLAGFFHYDLQTGKVYWKVNKNRARAGNEVCTPHPSGYLSVQLDGVSYLLHRVVWCLAYGSFPEGLLDHKDLNKRNNKLSNLRLADGCGNCCNQTIREDNTSGINGVNWHPRVNKWQGRVQYKGVRVADYFDNPADAEIFVKQERERMHKQFANHGVKP